MKPNKIKKTDKPASTSKRWFLGIILAVWAIVTFLAFKAVFMPLQVENMIQNNNIIQKTTFDYKVDAIPNILYPQGGTVVPEANIMAKITKSIILQINSTVTSEKPVELKGTKSVSVKLVAEKLWERDFSGIAQWEFDLKGTSNEVINSSIDINIVDILGFIKNAEKATEAQPNKYILKIKPIVQGVITYEGSKIPLDTTPELIFEVSHNYIILVGGQEFINETPMAKTLIVPQNFELFGAKLSIISSRWVLSLLSLILLILLIIMFKRNINLNPKQLTEAEKIEKKYHTRLLAISREIEASNIAFLVLQDFKSLIQIADEKEQPILKFNNGQEKNVIFYVVDNEYVYKYEADNRYAAVPSSKRNFIPSRNGIYHE